MEATYPDAVLEVVEIDPGVTMTAGEMLGLSPTTRVVTHNRDAREVVEAKQGTATYDLVFGDAFNDYQVPYHLATREFAQRVRGLLKPDGLYLALVIDRMRGGRFMASVVRTLREVFPHVYVLSDVGGTLVPRARTYVVAASATALDLEPAPGDSGAGTRRGDRGRRHAGGCPGGLAAGGESRRADRRLRARGQPDGAHLPRARPLTVPARLSGLRCRT